MLLLNVPAASQPRQNDYLPRVLDLVIISKSRPTRPQGARHYSSLKKAGGAHDVHGFSEIMLSRPSLPRPNAMNLSSCVPKTPTPTVPL